MPSNEDDVMKQIQALHSTEVIPAAAGSSPDSQTPSTKNAIFVKKSLEKVTVLTPSLQDALWKLGISAILSNAEDSDEWPAACRAAARHAFRD